jgi:hypothetical protein
MFLTAIHVDQRRISVALYGLHHSVEVFVEFRAADVSDGLPGSLDRQVARPRFGTSAPPRNSTTGRSAVKGSRSSASSAGTGLATNSTRALANPGSFARAISTQTTARPLLDIL